MDTDRDRKTENGLVHVYCGDGKGKTTAALGLCVRAAGAGYTVVVAQFLKTRDTGELEMLKKLGVTILRVDGEYGFTWQLTSEDKEKMVEEHNRIFCKAVELCSAGTKTLLVLDELAAAFGCGLVDTQLVLNALQNRPEALELVITGRNPAPELLELADYVTEMRKVRHPMDKGIIARKGIEF